MLVEGYLDLGLAFCLFEGCAGGWVRVEGGERVVGCGVVVFFCGLVGFGEGV